MVVPYLGARTQAAFPAAFCTSNETLQARSVARKPNPRENQPQSRYGGWDYARDLTNHLFALVNTGQVFPAFGFLLLLLFAFLDYLLPESERAPVLYEFLALIRSSSGIPYLALLCVIVGASWLLRRQAQMYQKEIDRMAAIRSALTRAASFWRSAASACSWFAHCRRVSRKPRCGRCVEPLLGMGRGYESDRTQRVGPNLSGPACRAQPAG